MYPIHNKPYKKPKSQFLSDYEGWMGKRKYWFLHCNGSMKYDTVNKCWSHFLVKNWEYGLKFKSLKAVVRHLRKQKMPYGKEFELIGNLGQIYKITVKGDEDYFTDDVDTDTYFLLN